LLLRGWRKVLAWIRLCRGFYRVWAYGGYSGDLSPQLTLELLAGKEDAILIDVWPEARE
jgi:hypothetical protein